MSSLRERFIDTASQLMEQQGYHATSDFPISNFPIPNPKVLVAGATGNVGREVVAALREVGQAVVAAVRDPERAREMLGEEVETVAFAFDDPSTYAGAFAGVNRLFLIRPPQIADVERLMFPVVDYAGEAGVEHVVFVSLLGVERARWTPHAKVERYIAASGLPYTFLRPGFYMQNMNTTHREECLEGELCVPVGKARTSFVDVRDIGAAAARVLVEPGHEGAAYDLTGGEALDYDQVAALFTEVLGRKVVYGNPSMWRFVRTSLARGVPFKLVLIMLVLYTTTRMGMAERVAPDLERLLGRPPITVRQYIEDYAHVWA